LEAQDFASKLLQLRQVDPRAYRTLLGIARAMYMQTNRRPPRRASARVLHERIQSRVRPIDYRRADALRNTPELVALARRRAA
jgi:hypothetical protein